MLEVIDRFGLAPPIAGGKQCRLSKKQKKIERNMEKREYEINARNEHTENGKSHLPNQVKSILKRQTWENKKKDVTNKKVKFNLANRKRKQTRKET